jgi:hypothetical protein
VTNEQFERERRYQSAISVARTMLKRGLINEAEFRVIDTMLLEKYKPLLGSLCAVKTAETP